ncbi:hypothetical protein MOSE0_E00606 [Monosporozyma servazzii]
MDNRDEQQANYKSVLHSASGTPVMNSIQEEDSPTPPTFAFETPYLDTNRNISSTNLEVPNNNDTNNNISNIGTNRPFFTSPQLSRPNSGFYSMQEANNSSSSIIYNPTFSFGASDDNTNTNNPVTTNNTNLNNNVFGKLVSPYANSVNNSSITNLSGALNIPTREKRRSSYKYLPSNANFGPPGAPPPPPPQTRTRSPVRSSSPETTKRHSALLDSPFNFNTSTLQPPLNSNPNGHTPHSNTPPSSASRASFRKGHRYKHSSVSMNFFQEPEVKIPLNIAKALPIPDFHDLKENLIWPRAYVQLSIVALEIIVCLITYQLGHIKNWNNFLTLAHFITYDIIGSLIIIFIENVSQFEVWSTGTLTFPFGLNRIDVLLSFASAVSLCFVGLDLVFHVLEETIVFFVEQSSTNEHVLLDKGEPKTQHEEIVSQIPHSHHGKETHLLFSDSSNSSNVQIWFFIIALNFFLANLSLYKTYVTSMNSQMKTKNPLITIAYTIYLVIYPFVEGQGMISMILDHIATILIAIFILMHGYTIAEWTSTILLNGFCTTTLTGFTITDSNDTGNDDKVKEKAKSTNLIRQASLTSLPIASGYHNKSSTTYSNRGKSNNHGLKWNDTITDPQRIKSLIIEKIEHLIEFKSRCKLSYENLIISKINFNLYIVLIKITMQGGSNDDEIHLMNAIENCIKKCLPHVETTIEIDRV